MKNHRDTLLKLVDAVMDADKLIGQLIERIGELEQELAERESCNCKEADDE